MIVFSRQNIPVLMYHALIDKKVPDVHFVHVLKHEFAKQMEWLYEHGYKTLSLNELYGHLRNGIKADDKTVVITFDDGYHSLYTYATPILQRYGFSAVLFLTTAAVGKTTYGCLPNCRLYPIDDRPLTWGELKEMQQKGWEIQAHGHRHFAHPSLQGKALEEEISLSKQAISDNLQFNAEFYCYPYGDYNGETLGKVSELGFKAAFSVRPGFANTRSDFRRICRINVIVSDDIRLFRMKLRNGYGTIKEMFNWKIGEIKILLSRNESLMRIVYKNKRWIRKIFNIFP